MNRLFASLIVFGCSTLCDEKAMGEESLPHVETEHQESEDQARSHNRGRAKTPGLHPRDGKAQPLGLYPNAGRTTKNFSASTKSYLSAARSGPFFRHQALQNTLNDLVPSVMTSPKQSKDATIFNVIYTLQKMPQAEQDRILTDAMRALKLRFPNTEIGKQELAALRTKLRNSLSWLVR